MGLLEEMMAKKAKAAKTPPAEQPVPNVLVVSAEAVPVFDSSTLEEGTQISVMPSVTAMEETKPITPVALSLEDSDDFSIEDMDKTILSQALLTMDDIIPTIRQLDSMSDMNADSEMDRLKAALMANPAAVSLMLPEDIGTLVRTLRRVKGIEAVKAAKSPSKSKAKAPKVDLSDAAIAEVDDF